MVLLFGGAKVGTCWNFTLWASHKIPSSRRQMNQLNALMVKLRFSKFEAANFKSRSFCFPTFFLRGLDPKIWSNKFCPKVPTAELLKNHVEVEQFRQIFVRWARYDPVHGESEREQLGDFLCLFFSTKMGRTGMTVDISYLCLSWIWCRMLYISYQTYHLMLYLFNNILTYNFNNIYYIILYNYIL